MATPTILPQKQVEVINGLVELGKTVRSDLNPVSLEFDPIEAMTVLAANLSETDQVYLYLVSIGLLLSHNRE